MSAELFDHHRALLEARAIAPAVARARGYSSTVLPGWLRQQGFSHQVAGLVPGLVIPVRDVHGDIRFHQYRPDKPRVRDGKPVKYETPARTRLVLDVPPQVRGKLASPDRPLWVTEGPLKADAAVSAGLDCIATFGVFGWRGRNGRGGKTVLPDWEFAALDGREVYLVPDSDVATSPMVADAVSRLGAVLSSRGADVRYVFLPPAADGGKTGLDDWLARNGPDTAGLLALADDEPPSRVRAGAAVAPPDPTGAAEPAHLHTPPALASDQDILRQMVRTLRVCKGLVGENRNAKVTYLALTSRLLDKQVSLAVKGLSSSGKSYTIECVLGLFPPEAVYTMTAMSERALIYLDEPLSHRTVVLYEATALREGREKAEDNQTAYIVRSLLSEGRIEYPTVLRDDDGKLRTVKLVKEGPTNLITTTTSVSLHGENETRMLSLPSNDSQAQTRAVLISSSADDDQDGGPDFSEWHQLQRWLAQASHQVVIPFAMCIGAQIPPVAVRLRRDWNTVRALIRAHAMLHQLNRKADEHGRVIATIDDYAAARSLVADLVAEAAGSAVPPSVRETVELVRALTVPADEGDEPPDPDGVKVARVAALLKLERSAATRRLHTARDRGYLVNLEDKKGKPARYVPGDPLPGEVIVLPEVHTVCTGPCTHLARDEIAGQGCDCTGVCRCAADAGPLGEDDR